MYCRAVAHCWQSPLLPHLAAIKPALVPNLLAIKATPVNSKTVKSFVSAWRGNSGPIFITQCPPRPLFCPHNVAFSGSYYDPRLG